MSEAHRQKQVEALIAAQTRLVIAIDALGPVRQELLAANASPEMLQSLFVTQSALQHQLADVNVMLNKRRVR